jgi:hypothetical protein
MSGPTGDRAANPASTGVGEVRFDDVAAAEAAMSTPEWRAVIEDAATFMDMQRVTALWAEEHASRSHAAATCSRACVRDLTRRASKAG